jgi:hypothetical protein
MKNRDCVSMVARFLVTDLKVNGLALDPRNPNVLYAAEPHGVYKTGACPK